MRRFLSVGLFALLGGTAGALPPAALALSCMPETSQYEVKNRKVVFVSRNSQGTTEEVVTAINPQSFRSLRHPQWNTGPCGGRINDYAQDKQRVYYRGKVIAGANPATFEFIDQWFAKDKTGVYGLGRKLTTRVADFRVIGQSEGAAYATDGDRHFYKDTVLDGDGFEFVAKGYDLVRTSTAVYYRGQALDVDARTFEVLNPSVSMTRDKDKVYYRHSAIPNADPATIKQINGYLWKDKRAVFLEGREIVGLDPETVRTFPIGGEYTADAHSVYHLYQKIHRDAATFTVLQPWYTKDKAGVYHKDVLIEAADPQTFSASSMSNGQDKNYRFYENQVFCKIRADAPGAAKACSGSLR